MQTLGPSFLKQKKYRYRIISPNNLKEKDIFIWGFIFFSQSSQLNLFSLFQAQFQNFYYIQKVYIISYIPTD